MPSPTSAVAVLWPTLRGHPAPDAAPDSAVTVRGSPSFLPLALSRLLSVPPAPRREVRESEGGDRERGLPLWSPWQVSKQ